MWGDGGRGGFLYIAVQATGGGQLGRRPALLLINVDASGRAATTGWGGGVEGKAAVDGAGRRVVADDAH